MRTCLRALTAIALIVTTVGCVATPSSDPDIAVRFFNDVGYRGSPNGTPMTGPILAETRYNDHVLERWEVPIIMMVEGDPTGEFNKQINAITARITKLTGVPIIPRNATNYPIANLFITFSDEPGFAFMAAENVPCVAGTHTRADGSIRMARIRISTIESDLIDHCIAHEMFHAIGFAHSDLLPSVVNRHGELRQFSRWDEMAIRTLYAVEIFPGMTRRQSLPIARDLIKGQLHQL